MAKNAKVSTPSGGKKRVRIPRIGWVTWDQQSGELKYESDPAYQAATEAVVAMMLSVDRLHTLYVMRADIYPVYGGEGLVDVHLRMVAVDTGTINAHDPEFIAANLDGIAAFASTLNFDGKREPAPETPDESKPTLRVEK